MDEHKKLIDMIQDFDTAMLVTHHPQHGVDARPMAIAEVDSDGGLWFVSNRHSGKMADIAADSHAAVTLQSGSKFVSISGKLKPVDNRQKVRDLWQESWKVWFPKGVDDRSIILLNLIPDSGEYWDNSGFQGAKYLLKAGKAYLQGSTPDSSKDEHARVSM